MGLAGVLALALLAAACSGAPENTANCPFGFREVPAGTQTKDLSCADLTNAKLNGAIWSNTTCPDGSNTDTNTTGRCR